MSETQGTTHEPIHYPISEKLRLIRFRMKRERTRFSKEIRLLPGKLVAAVIVLFVLAQAVAQMIAAKVGPPWPELSANANIWSLIGVVTAVGLPAAFLILLVGYVNRDAKRRGMNSTLWTLFVIVLLPAYLVFGFLVYFLLREPLPYPCPDCSAVVSARFNYCPECKFNLRPACPKCMREVQIGDHYCTHCASELEAAAAE